MITREIPFRFLRPAPDGRKDHFDYNRVPAVWPLDDEIYIVIGGLRRLVILQEANTPPETLIRVRIVDAASFEEAAAFIRRPKKPPTQTGRGHRPLLGTLQRILKKLKAIGPLTPQERGFLAALEFVVLGKVKNWPRRVYSLVHGRSPDNHPDHQRRDPDPGAPGPGDGDLAWDEDREVR